MNNSNPLIPQGSNLEQKIKDRSRVKIAVFVVLAAHVLFLGPLLMLGCKREQPPAAVAETNTTLPPLDTVSNELPAETNLAPVVTPVEAPPATNPLPLPVPAMTEYTVVKGDSYYTIGKKFSITTKAIAEANPGVDPAKLQIGKTLHIPAPTAAPAATHNGVAAPGGDEPYKVKSGDTLTTIAKAHGTTVKALRAANNLTTDRITVGQNLKMPAPKIAAPAAAPAPVGTPPAN